MASSVPTDPLVVFYEYTHEPMVSKSMGIAIPFYIYLPQFQPRSAVDSCHGHLAIPNSLHPVDDFSVYFMLLIK
jgi:hypothetical protein